MLKFFEENSPLKAQITVKNSKNLCKKKNPSKWKHCIMYEADEASVVNKIMISKSDNLSDLDQIHPHTEYTSPCLQHHEDTQLVNKIIVTIVWS